MLLLLAFAQAPTAPAVYGGIVDGYPSYARRPHALYFRALCVAATDAPAP